jgi:hypothetical protein
MPEKAISATAQLSATIVPIPYCGCRIRSPEEKLDASFFLRDFCIGLMPHTFERLPGVFERSVLKLENPPFPLQNILCADPRCVSVKRYSSEISLMNRLFGLAL